MLAIRDCIGRHEVAGFFRDGTETMPRVVDECTLEEALELARCEWVEGQECARVYDADSNDLLLEVDARGGIVIYGCGVFELEVR